MNSNQFCHVEQACSFPASHDKANGFKMSAWLRHRPTLHYLFWRLGLAAADTATSVAEQACLTHHAARKMRLVEIGVWHGVNTREFRKVMAPDGLLTAIDPFFAGRFGLSYSKLIAHAEVSSVSNGRVEFYETLSEIACKQIPDPCFDFVFIDGDHSWDGITKDWTLWAPRIAPGGIIALHDSRPCPGHNNQHTSVVKFTQQTVLPDERFELIDEVDTLTVLRRRR